MFGSSKKYIRSLLNEHISYDNILKFVNSIFDVMFTPKMKHKNDAPQMKVIVDKFLRLYNIGIIKFPNEYDFDSTYNNKFNHIDVTQEESTDIEKPLMILLLMKIQKLRNHVMIFNMKLQQIIFRILILPLKIHIIMHLQNLMIFTIFMKCLNRIKLIYLMM